MAAVIAIVPPPPAAVVEITAGALSMGYADGVPVTVASSRSIAAVEL